jgi:hypothetical protein
MNEVNSVINGLDEFIILFEVVRKYLPRQQRNTHNSNRCTCCGCIILKCHCEAFDKRVEPW